MPSVSLSALETAVSQSGYPASIQEETQQVLFELEVQDIKIPAFVHPMANGQFIQLLSFIPCKLAPEAVADCSRMLHQLNREIDMPGFGMDEENAMTFYRLLFPILPSGIDQELLNSYLQAMHQVIKTFAVLIQSVATAQISYQDVINKAQELHQQEG